MRSILILFLFFASSLFASKARMEALGQDSSKGSFYIHDDRFLFSNPSLISKINNLFFLEWGKANSSAEDTSASPHPEGGLIKRSGIFNWGIYLGQEINSQNILRPTGYLKNDGRVDLFLGGNAGFSWGVRANYASSTDETQGLLKSHDAYGFGIGITVSDLEFFANLDLKDTSRGAVDANDVFDSRIGIDLGFIGPFGDFVFFANYKLKGFEELSVTSKGDYKKSEYTVAIGQVTEVDSKTRIYVDLKVQKVDESYSVTSSLPVTPFSYDGLYFPIAIALENKTLDWLQLRGSISQDLGGGKDVSGKRISQLNSTNVNFGASLIFSGLRIDGLLGTTGRADNDSKEGVLSLESLMTRVGVSYSF